LQSGSHAVVIDMQIFGSSPDSSPHDFFRAFATAVADQLGIAGPADWDMSGPPAQSATRFLEQEALKKLDKPIVLGVDETDLLFGTPIQNAFFGMVRHWHNNRGTPSKPHWKKLNLLLVTSTEPYLFITDRLQSPFNVAQSFEMKDFTMAEVEECNRRHGSPLFEAEVGKLFELLHGHPYLIRRALYLVLGNRSGDETGGPARLCA
jgi:hypothetical protein